MMAILFVMASGMFNYTKASITGYTNIGSSAFSGTDGGTIDEAANGGTKVGLYRNISWDDFEFSTTQWRGGTTSGQASCIIFRYTNTSNFYALTYNYNQGKFRLKKNNLNNNNNTNQLAVWDGANASNNHAVDIRVEGTSIKVWVNGTLRIDATDATHSSGSLGFLKSGRWDDNARWKNATWTEYISSTVPTVTTITTSSIASTTATSGGNVTSDGGGTVTDYGVCWGTSSTPTTDDNLTDDGSGTGSFVSSITGLSPGTIYYYRAYAINEAGTAYGTEYSFTTNAIVPTVTTIAISDISCTSASSGGSVTDDGGATVTDFGVCWSTYSSPTTMDNLTDDGSGIGSFSSSITGVAAGTTIYVRAYATNSAGTAYGSEESFTSLSALSAGTVGSAQSICYNTTPVSLTNNAAPTGATGAYTYQWQSSTDGSSYSNISSETSTTYSPGALTSNTWYRRAETSATCGTVYTSGIKMTVYSDLAAGTIGSAETICYNASPATLTNTASPTGGTTSYTYQWQSSTDGSSFSDVSGATSATYSPGALTADTWYRRAETSGSCGTVYSSSIKVTVIPEILPGSIKF